MQWFTRSRERKCRAQSAGWPSGIDSEAFADDDDSFFERHGVVKNEKSLYCVGCCRRRKARKEKDDDGETSFTASNIKP